MKFEWEKIYEQDHHVTYRAKVLGGWLVNSVYRVGDNHRPNMVFMEDKNHRWFTEENWYIDVAIEDFHVDHEYFSVRIVNCLKVENIKTIRDLLSWCEHQLCCIANLGRKSLTEINDLLKLAGLEINSHPPTTHGEHISKCRACRVRE